MILDEYVKVELVNRNYKKLSSKYGLKDVSVGDIVEIPINKLSKSSHYMVNVSCDYCDINLEVPFKRYNKSTEVIDKYSCSNKDCSNQKIKDVCQEKYGVDNPFQSKNVKKKIKETMLYKYGVEHPMFLEETKGKIKDTCLERYGVDNYTKTDEYKVKTKETNLERYGVEWAMQSDVIKERSKKSSLKIYGVDHPHKSKVVRDKFIETNMNNCGFPTNLMCPDNIEQVKHTNLDRYGVEYPLQSEEIKDKIKITCLERYGVDNPLKSKLVRDKMYNTNIERYGNKYVSMSPVVRSNFKMCCDDNYIKYLGNNYSSFKCYKGHNFKISTNNYYGRMSYGTVLCTECYPIGDTVSINEQEVYNYIKEIYDGEIIQSYRDGLEIDIYLPALKIGFEYNGLYWHSDKYKDKNYHSDKTKFFKERGIRIIHIWEDDCVLKRNIIKSQISNMVGLVVNKVYGRTCVIKELVDIKMCRKFLDDNHIQGFVPSTLKLGLFYSGELVSIMTFDKFEGRKKMEENGWTLSRFCSKIDYSVIGGFTKLLNNFIKIYNPIRIVSYSDNDWSLGGIYETSGFSKVSDVPIDYKYIIDGVRVNKSKFRKSNLPGDLSESQYMSSNGILRVYNCGKSKYEMILS